jgi:hypothetical protein
MVTPRSAREPCFGKNDARTAREPEVESADSRFAQVRPLPPIHVLCSAEGAQGNRNPSRKPFGLPIPLEREGVVGAEVPRARRAGQSSLRGDRKAAGRMVPGQCRGRRGDGRPERALSGPNARRPSRRDRVRSGARALRRGQRDGGGVRDREPRRAGFCAADRGGARVWMLGANRSTAPRRFEAGGLHWAVRADTRRVVRACPQSPCAWFTVGRPKA